LPRTDVEQRLQSLGLSGYQARIYLKALELGPLSGAQLAERAQVPRSKVYEVCQALIDKGLIEPESGTPRRFRAMPLARLVEQRKSQLLREAEALEQKHREVEALLSQMVPRTEPHEGGLAVLQGEARVTAHVRMMVRAATERIQVLLADGSLGLLGLLMEEKPPAAAVRVVHRLAPEDMPRVQRLAERGVAFRHAKAPIPVTSVTVDRTHSLILIHTQAGEAPTTALWSSEPSLVAAEEGRFTSSWRDASTLARRQKELSDGREGGTTEVLSHEDDRSEGFAGFAAACIAGLGNDGEPVDIALGWPFLAVAGDERLKALLAKHRTRLLLPFPRDARSKAIVEAASSLGETRLVPPWLGDVAMLIASSTSLAASMDPASGQLETIIATSEPGLVRWRRRVYDAAWEMAAERRPEGQEQTALWSFSHRTAEAEAWLRHVVSIATSVVEVRGPPAAEAYIASLVKDPKVKVHRVPLPRAAEGSFVVEVDGRLLLVLEGVKFSTRGASRLLQAIDVGVLTDSRALLAFDGGAPGDGKRQR
jgi:sugar-specific transcriptional regulator TrmB